MKSLRLTIKAWPVIALATIGLCYLTQTVAKSFGIELPDQANIEIVKRSLGWNWNFAFLCFQVLVLLPAVEELVFRYLLWRLPTRTLDGRRKTEDEVGRKTEDGRRGRTEDGRRIGSTSVAAGVVTVVSSALFSAAHYIAQPFPDSAFIALFFFGLAQCWLYKKSGHLWCAILNHALFNLTNLVLLFMLPEA